MLTFFFWFCVGILLAILYKNTPRKRRVRARRYAEQQRVLDLKQLSKDCRAIYSKAILDTPHFWYYQDVCWIEWHTKLADPECDDPGKRPIFSPEEIAKDVQMSKTSRWGSSPSFRITDHRERWR